MKQQKQTQSQNSVVYFTILLILDALLILFVYVGKQTGIIPLFLFRIILVIGTKVLKNSGWMVYYVILTIFALLYMFDPVGLWMTGHGQKRDQTANAFCVLAFIGLATALYLGYLFKKTTNEQIDDQFIGQGYSDAKSKRNTKQVDQFSGQGYSLA